MAEQKSSPFRQKSLERLSSPERLDQLLRVVDRKSWLPLGALGLLVAALVGWAVMGKIPERVEGPGILIHPRDVVDIHAPGPGYLEDLLVAVDDVVREGDELALLARPDLEKELELQQDKSRELARQLQSEMNDGDVPNVEELELTREMIASHLTHGRRFANDLRRQDLQELITRRAGLEEQLRHAKSVSASREEQLERQRRAEEQGVGTRMQVVEAEVPHRESLQDVAEIEAQLRDLQTGELQVQETYRLRVEHIDDREQQFSDVLREIERIENTMLEEGRIVAEQGGRVVELSATPGRYLRAGDRIGAIAAEAGSKLVSVSYFRVRDGKKLEPGDLVHVSPVTVERERFGSIVGKVTRVSSRGVTLAHAGAVIGNMEMAETMIAGGYRIEVEAELEVDPQTVSEFAWTSPRGPDLRITPGTTTQTRVVVDERKPITYIIPALKQSTGID
ncbi:MAG: NHLP bacteriocin system secretion protein [bacterium]|nr:NHLP bacteriocin system secretion protein [bacterium]